MGREGRNVAGGEKWGGRAEMWREGERCGGKGEMWREGRALEKCQKDSSHLQLVFHHRSAAAYISFTDSTEFELLVRLPFVPEMESNPSQLIDTIIRTRVCSSVTGQQSKSVGSHPLPQLPALCCNLGCC